MTPGIMLVHILNLQVTNALNFSRDEESVRKVKDKYMCIAAHNHLGY